jgi:type I restriction enzyme S subunit
MSDNAVLLYRKLTDEKERLLKQGKIKKQKSKISISDTDKPPFSIPARWCWVRLGEVSHIQEGPGIRKHQYCNEGIQFLTVTNILEGSVDLYKSVKYISQNEFQSKYTHFKINKGDIVVACSGGSWGKSAVFQDDDPIILNTSTLRLRFFGDLANNHYLYHLTKTEFFKNQIAAHSTGQQPNYGYSHYSIAYIPLPPLPEQKRIVSILDEALGAIQRAKENAQKNLANARELFESYLNRVFTEKGEGWEETTLGTVANFKNGLNYDRNSNGQTLPVVGVGDFQTNSYVPIDSLGTATIDGTLDAKYELQKNDILTVRSNGSKDLIGRCMLVPDLNEVTSYSGFVIRIRSNQDRIAPRFLLQFLKSRGTVYLLTRDGGGANINNINQGKLSALPLSFPTDRDEQNRLADVLDQISQEAEALKGCSQRKSTALDELKQSILQKAFTGQLTAKSPELEAVG